MFTGIVQDSGKIIIRTLNGDSIDFIAEPCDLNFLAGSEIGDSISVNGACMTITSVDKNRFHFTTVNESISKTNLSSLNKDDIVNLEKAMTLSSKLDGHIVQGHIDCTGIVRKILKLKGSYELYLEFNAKYSENIINVGSIAVNGVSLTIAEINEDESDRIQIKIALIPHTIENTNFRTLKENDIVNIEFDMLGKYVGRILKNKKTGK